MSRPTTFSLRPFDKREWKGTLEGAFRIHLNRADFHNLDLQIGDLCTITVASSGNSGLAIAWLSPDPKLSQRITRVSESLRDLYHFSLEDKVQISKSDDTRVRAKTVYISSSEDGASLSEGFRNTQALRFWITHSLASLETICSGVPFDVQPKGGSPKSKKSRRFKIDRIEPPMENPQLYIFDEETTVVLPNDGGKPVAVENPTEKVPEPNLKSVKLNAEGIGGLEQQIEVLNEQLSEVLKPDARWKFLMPSKVQCSRGIILHGPEGTGKTLLLDRFAEAPWVKVQRITKSALGSKPSEACKMLEKAFIEARSLQPSLITLDGFEELFGVSDEQTADSRTVECLIEEMKKALGTDIVVVATAVNLASLPKRLRGVDTFGITLEVPMPDSRTRTHIMQSILQSPRHEGLCQQVGESTHGFTGRDLVELCATALKKTQKRLNQTLQETGRIPPPAKQTDSVSSETDDSAAKAEQEKQEQGVSLVEYLTEDAFQEARLVVRPTPMKEVFLEPPKVTWDDIGGAENVKEALRKVIVWPFKYPKAMKAIGFTPQKGILLYGPPGCSKTLIAQAVANQGGLNFLAVKGAELLNMYVGESERSIREVFRKARAASPSIVFFDEFDSIGRNDRSSGRTNGLNVLTTLLNEMDGIESLTNVLVLAATNAPEVLDPALMRPGRMDTILYVGPPNLVARREILNIQAKGRPLADDVNFDDLAVRTDGYSGAEVVQIFDKAIENAFDEWEKGEQNEMPVICQRHFEVALGKVFKQITPAMKMRFEHWQPGGVTKLL